MSVPILIFIDVECHFEPRADADDWQKYLIGQTIFVQLRAVADPKLFER